MARIWSKAWTVEDDDGNLLGEILRTGFWFRAFQFKRQVSEDGKAHEDFETLEAAAKWLSQFEKKE